MLTNQVKNNIERSGQFKESNFKFSLNANMYYVFSSQLYGNKIQSVIREISTNAHDAHVAVDNKEPFEVHLPTWLEPWFSVRDFGPGLTEEEVFNIYTTYGESTKTTSNLYTGYLGLGSKSPLCISDSFTAISYKDGVKTTYNLLFNEDRIPTCLKLTEEDTEEKNGFEVSIPVSTNDISKFNKEATRVYTFFNNKPKLNCTLSYYNLTSDINGNNWSFYNNSELSGLYATMGNVAYPVKNCDSVIPEHLKSLLNAKIIINFEIGDIEPSASREELSWTEQTTNVVIAKLQEIKSVLTKTVEAKIASCSNLFEARIKASELKQQNLSNYISWKDIFYNGVSLNYTSTININPQLFDIQKSYYQFSKTRRSNTNDIQIANSITYVWLDDIKKKKRFSSLVLSKQGSYCYLISSYEGSGSTKQLFETLLGKSIISVSELPKTSNSNNSRPRKPILCLDLNTFNIAQNQTTINNNDFFVYTNRTDTPCINSSMSFWCSDTALKTLIKSFNSYFKHNRIDGKVLFLKKVDDGKIKKKKLINLYTYIQDIVNKHIKDEQIIKKIELLETINNHELKEIFKSLLPQQCSNNEVNKILEMIDSAESVRHLVYIMRISSIPFTYKQCDDFKQSLNELVTKHKPMLSILNKNRTPNPSELNIINNYIKE